MEARSVELLLRYRYILSLISILVVLLLTAGAQKLTFDSDYKSFFDKDNPQLVAFEVLQTEYTKLDSLVLMIRPTQGDVFNARNLALIRSLTEEMWLAPFSIRVDSLSNYQHSWADDNQLTVEDLVPPVDTLDAAGIARVRDIALQQRELVDRLISKDGTTTVVVAALELPDIVAGASPEQQQAQAAAREASFAAISEFGNDLIARTLVDHPDLEIHLMGVPIVNYSFNNSAAKDSSTLIPMMYGIIFLALAVFFRSFGSVVSCMLVIAFATMAGMGWAGWVGYNLNSITVIAPVIILTIAVCDSVHLIVVYLRYLSQGLKPVDAIRESLRANLQPIVLTSVTTMVGFLTLNFSESPLFRAFGNISAFGVLFAMLISLTLMPTLISLLVRKAKPLQIKESLLTRLADIVIQHRKRVFWGSIVVAAAMIALVPLNETNNDPINYFKEGVPYRDAANFSQKYLPGIKQIHFSVDCGESSCVNDVEFLSKLEQFTDWLETEPGVEYVGSYVSVMKRLNQNMHGDASEWYRLPESRDLAAQYQLLYELSLPYGLDLNNLVNFDKSATRVSVFLRKVRTVELIRAEERAAAWFDINAPELKSHGSSVDMMFAVQNIRDINAMSIGAIFALFGVTLTILFATRSVRHGLLSMVPNAFPAAMGLGLWGLLVGEVNAAVTIVFSITLGLVVDNTVHFISKYRRALAKGETVEGAVRYAFSTVGAALIITAVVLTIGFGLLTLSDFNMNAYMGGLTAMTIVIALVFDFMMLPALLLMVDKSRDNPVAPPQ